MKRTITAALVLLLLLSLCACQFRDGIKEPVDFYYKRVSYVYGSADGVLASEQREASGHREDLTYLLALYLRGPLDEALQSPFPAGCRILSITREGRSLRITMNAAFASLEGLDLTIGCACLTKTCMALADVDSVTIESADPDTDASVSITMTQADLLLYDDSQPVPTETQ